MELIWDEKRKKQIRYYPPNDPEYYTEGLTNEDNEDGSTQI